MPLDFIPRTDSSFKAWFDTFTDYALAHAAALGLSPAQVAELVAKRAAWDAGFGRHIEARNAAMGATAEKDRLRKEAEQMIRFCSGYIQRRRDLEHLDWKWLTDDTCSPYLHVHRVPGTVFYRAQYIDRKLRLGPLGQSVSASVTL
jgi:hypothetical protein